MAASRRSRIAEGAPPDSRVVIAGRFGLLVLLIVAWEIVGRQQPVLLSYPTRIAATFVAMARSGDLAKLLSASGQTLIMGWLIAVFGGAILGIVIGWVRPCRLMIEPFMNALYSTPLIALVPLMVLWFGLGLKALVVCVTLVAIFPMMIMTVTGVQNAGREYIEVAKSFRLGTAGMLFKVVLPGALPYMYVGLRLATARALTGTIIAEFLIPGDGIGDAIRSAGDAFDSDHLYGLILIVAAAAMILDATVRKSGPKLSINRMKS